MVLVVRQSVSKENILKFDGTALLIHTINNGMIDKSSMGSFTIGDITVDNNFAKGQIIAYGTESPFSLNFYKEDGQWKYDLTSSFPIAILVLQKLVKELGKKDSLIQYLVQKQKIHQVKMFGDRLNKVKNVIH